MDAEENCAALILAAYVFESSENDIPDELPRKVRKVWRKKWVASRERDGFCSKLYRELRTEEPLLHQNFLRMSVNQFDYILALVSPLIAKEDTVMRASIPASDRLILTLRFLATGENFRSLQYLFRIPANTISTIIPEVLDALYNMLVGEYLRTPNSPTAWQAVARQYNELWQFPNCIGSVDGKHVVMVAPPNSGSIFYNYKGTHSIVLMGIADAEYKLLYVDVGRNGRYSDGGVFNRCNFAQAMDAKQLGLPPPQPLPGRELPVPYSLVADDAFALRENIMKPYSQRGLTMVQRVFNYRLSRARRVIENVFGIMSARFRVLRKPIHLSAEKTKKVTLACCVLHNYLLTTNKKNYAPPHSFDQYDVNGELIPGDWRQDTMTMYPLQREAHPVTPLSAKDVQKELSAYFIEEGDLEWQYKLI